MAEVSFFWRILKKSEVTTDDIAQTSEHYECASASSFRPDSLGG
jgi:hypothetical protein